MFLALYEGIGGEKLYELTSLVIENVDFDTNKVKLTDIDGNERTITISNKLKYILKAANEQDEYKRGNGKVESVRTSSTLAPSKYVIKVIDRNNNGNKMIKYNTLSQKIVTLKKCVGYDFVSPQTLRDSGAINRVLELMRERQINQPDLEIFKILQLPEEYNFSYMQIYDIKQKFELATSLKRF